MTEHRPLSERIAEDGIEIALAIHTGVIEHAEGTSHNWDIILRIPAGTQQPTDHQDWRSMRVEFGSSIRDGDSVPSDDDEAAAIVDMLVSNAIEIENARDFSDWLADFRSRDEQMTIAEIQELHDIYTRNVAVTADLKRFLGLERATAYLYESEFDI